MVVYGANYCFRSGVCEKAIYGQACWQLAYASEYPWKFWPRRPEDRLHVAVTIKAATVSERTSRSETYLRIKGGR